MEAEEEEEEEEEAAEESCKSVVLAASYLRNASYESRAIVKSGEPKETNDMQRRYQIVSENQDIVTTWTEPEGSSTSRREISGIYVAMLRNTKL
ncbi:hypothetical protein D9C73_024633 [Collichthys lucidus]|uniref:Uncharacterized protein n=1 Tax=Collichthys lucidus TaxID=240159 RepID=A0A4U5VQQ2_COLLU|nr:hypothetical protein D9C73_024633 [Collichthys lucidus]